MSNEFRVIYSSNALEDLEDIYNYIAYKLKATQNAQNQVNRIRKEIRSLDCFPNRYVKVDLEPWASMKMRRLTVNNYNVYYLIDEEKMIVTIVRIFLVEEMLEILLIMNKTGIFIPVFKLPLIHIYVKQSHPHHYDHY